MHTIEEIDIAVREVMEAEAELDSTRRAILNQKRKQAPYPDAANGITDIQNNCIGRRFRKGELLSLEVRSPKPLLQKLARLRIHFQISMEDAYREYLRLVQRLNTVCLFEPISDYSWLAAASVNDAVFDSQKFIDSLEGEFPPAWTEFAEDMFRDEIYSDVVPKPVGLPLHLVSGVCFDRTNKRTITNFPPHNISEVIDAIAAKIENPRMRARAICDIIKAPDFAAGGTILTTEAELRECYATGKGQMIHKCDVTIDRENAINFTVLEPISAGVILEKAIRDNKVKGVSKFTSRDKDVLVIPASGANPEGLKASILELPGFTTSIGFNMTVVIDFEEIERLPIHRILQCFISHRIRFISEVHRCSKERAIAKILDEMFEFKKKYGHPRRTRIEITG